MGALMLAYVDSLRAEGKVSARGTGTAVDLHIKSAWPALWSRPADELTLEDLLPVVARVVAAGKLREAGKVRPYIRPPTLLPSEPCKMPARSPRCAT